MGKLPKRLATETKWLFVLLCFAPILLFSFSFLYFEQILYGSMISTQFHNNLLAFLEAKEGLYIPSMNFDFALGMNLLGDSQQLILHPIKWLLAIVGLGLGLDTAVTILHLVLLFPAFIFLGSVLYEKDWRDANSLVALSASACCFSFGSATVANLVHYSFIVALPYGLVLFAFSIRLLEQQSKFDIVGLCASCVFMLLAGNYCIQWIMLLALTIFLISKNLSENRRIDTLILIGFSIFFGFLISTPQLLPTFEMMLSSERATFGGLGKFQQSAGPLQVFSYLSPAFAYNLFRHAPDVFGYFGDNNVVEGVHYVGIIPICFLIHRLLVARKLDGVEKALFVVLLLMIARGIGVFSPINIILNELPIFGQFRFPVRSFWGVDLAVCMMFYLSLTKLEQTQELLKSAKFLLVFCGVLISVIVLNLYLVSDAWTFFDIENIFFVAPLLILISLIQLCRVFEDRLLFLKFALAFLAVADVTIHSFSTPTHWHRANIQNLLENAHEVDNLCSEQDNEFLIFNDTLWPDFDTPSFWYDAKFGASSKAVTEQNLIPQGLSCKISYSLDPSSLVSKDVKKFVRWLQSLDLETRSEALAYFDGARQVEKVPGQFEKEVKLKKVNSFSDATLEKINDFFEEKEIQAFETRSNISRLVFEIFYSINAEWIFSSTKRRVSELGGGSGLVILPPPFSYFILDESLNPITVSEVRGNLVKVPTKHSQTLMIYHIPLFFFIGVIISIISLFCFIIILFKFQRLKLTVSRSFGANLLPKISFRLQQPVFMFFLIGILSLCSLSFVALLYAGVARHTPVGIISLVFSIIYLMLLSALCFLATNIKKTKAFSTFAVSVLVSFYLFGQNFMKNRELLSIIKQSLIGHLS